jgi:hypothetical protein
MDFGIVTAKVDEIGYISHAENLGYRHAWVTDSPMIRSNCWAVLALAAQATRTMRLGTAVNVPGLRLAPAVANGIATINRLAPGRCIIGLGTLISGLPRGGTVPDLLANARRGAARAGRDLPGDFHTAAMVTLALREPGGAADSARLVAEWSTTTARAGPGSTTWWPGPTPWGGRRSGSSSWMMTKARVAPFPRPAPASGTSSPAWGGAKSGWSSAWRWSGWRTTTSIGIT